MADNDTIKMTFEGVDDISKVIKKINKSLGSVEKTSEKTSKGIDGLSKSVKGVAGAFAGLASVGAALAFAKQSIELANIQIKAETKLEATIRATGGAAGFTAIEMKKMAKGFQEVTTFGDETIIGAQSLLLTFTKIGKEVLPNAVETVLDMAAALGTDLKGASIQLGKALNDPIKGVGALAEVGVSFSEQQREQIKQFVEVNDLASAQTVILDELANEFGGVARALAETDVGKIVQMKNSIGDMQEEIGKKLIPAQKAFFELVLDTAQGWEFIISGIMGARHAQEKLSQEQITKFTEAQTKANELRAILKDAGEDAKTVILPDGSEVRVSRVTAKIKRLGEEMKAIKGGFDSVKEFRVSVKEEKQAGTTTDGTTGPTDAQIAAAEKLAMERVKAGEKALAKIKEMQVAEGKFFFEQKQAELAEQEAYETAIIESEQKIHDTKMELMSLEKEIEAERATEKKEKALEGVSFAVDTAMQVNSLIERAFSSRFAKERSEINDNLSVKRKAIKDSTKSEKQKNKELEKLDKEAAKKRHEIAMGEWRMNLIMAIANTALGITKSLASMSPPANFVMAALTGAAGAISIATIASNKPKANFALGGFVPGNNNTGDNVPVNVNSGEFIATSSQQRRLLDLAEGRNSSKNNIVSPQVSIGETTIVIQGNADAETIDNALRENREMVLDAIYQAVDAGEIDTTRTQGLI